MAKFIIGVKVIKDENGIPIEGNKQYYTFMSRYNSFIHKSDIALEFRSVEEARSWWDSYRVKYPDRIKQVSEYADLDTLSIRRVLVSYKLIEKLNI